MRSTFSGTPCKLSGSQRSLMHRYRSFLMFQERVKLHPFRNRQRLIQAARLLAQRRKESAARVAKARAKERRHGVRCISSAPPPPFPILPIPLPPSRHRGSSNALLWKTLRPPPLGMVPFPPSMRQSPLRNALENAPLHGPSKRWKRTYSAP